MRTTTDAQTGITINYPDEIALCFNPVLVEAENADSLSVGINIGIVRYYDVSVDAFGGNCYLDIEEYLQSLFDGMDTDIDYSQQMISSNQGLSVTFSINAVSGNDTFQFSFSSYVVWGAIIPNGRDDFRQLRHIKWFKNYPFVYGLYADASTAILFGHEDAPNSAEPITNAGIYNFNTDYLTAGAKYYVIYEYEGTIQQSVFDNYFDLTFYLYQNVNQIKLLIIETDDTTDEGIYLRWIDRHGYVAHWLFKVGDEQRQISAIREFSRNALLAYDMTYGYQRGSGRRQTMSRGDVVPMCAPLVDKDTFDYLQDLTTSPIVEMFAGYDSNNEPQWVGVGIQPGTFTKTRDDLQDFVFNMIAPSIPIQSL